VPASYFRAGVGAVIANDSGRVLALERSDVAGAWQFPQGGLKADEDSLNAVFREIEEETGIRRTQLELVARYPHPLAYELPPQHRSAKTGLGQVQYWFLFRFLGEDTDIRPPRDGEFRSWSWRPFDSVVAGAAEFRRPVYELLEARFATYFD
jgi:putative (di)nucleoside polyphosphate hydrolase